MITVYRNATIVTMDERNPVLRGDVVTDGERFVSVGGRYVGAADQTVEIGDDIIMPSLYNTHTHLAMSIMRNTADDLKLKDWLYKRIFPMEAKLDDVLVRAGVRLGLAELIRGGVTGVVDMYMYPDVVRSCLEESGMEGVVCCGDHDLDGNVDLHLRKQEKVLADSTDRVRGMLSFHAEYTCSEKYLDGIMALSQISRSGVVCHNSETLEEVGTSCTKHNELSPTMYLHSMGLLDYGGIMAHCVYCDKEDLALLKQCGCTVALNCASNLKLGSGVPPIVTMRDVGIRVTVGTDSAASNNRLDMWREMYLAAVLPKGTLNSPEAVTAQEVLRWGTVNGRQAMGMETSGIQKGAYANFVRIDRSDINLNPIGDVCSALVYAADAHNVKMTVCRGKVLYRDGKFVNGWDEEEIRKEANAAADELLSRC